LAETLLAFSDPLFSESGVEYLARACGAQADHTWQGWVEFVPVGKGTIVRSGRETTQPNREGLVYWASGLTPVYLEGALHRALNPVSRPVAAPVASPTFDGPAPDFIASSTVTESVLNPLSVYRKGESLLRRQLGALSSWHLVNIVVRYDLSVQPAHELNRMTQGELIELIVVATRERIETPTL
jgi:hypothetical protein